MPHDITAKELNELSIEREVKTAIVHYHPLPNNLDVIERINRRGAIGLPFNRALKREWYDQ